MMESAFLFLLVTGLKRLYIANQAEVFMAIATRNSDKLGSLTGSTYEEFLVVQQLWPAGFFVLGVLIIALVNWRYRLSILNSVLSYAVVFALFLSGFFSVGTIPQFFNSFCYWFSDDLKTAYHVGGSILTLAGFAFLGLSIMIERKAKSRVTTAQP
jgi:hypothetical protein